MISTELQLKLIVGGQKNIDQLLPKKFFPDRFSNGQKIRCLQDLILQVGRCLDMHV